MDAARHLVRSEPWGAGDSPGRRLSPVQVFRVLGRLVSTVSLQCVLKLNLQAQLAACVLADESQEEAAKAVTPILEKNVDAPQGSLRKAHHRNT